MRAIKTILFGVFTLLISCVKEDATVFKNLAIKESQINFENKLHSSPELNILNYIYYYNGAGVAAADFNNDGLEDLYFVSNENDDALYLNKGQLRFENRTKEANLNNNAPWTTGVTTVDINNDGLMDIYVCKVSGVQNLEAHNLLYVNQGVHNGVPNFKEEAKQYGLDFSGLSTQSAFFDYDQDGDLDMFLMNHSVHPNLNYGNGNQRKTINSVSGDKFYENINGYYQDVTAKTGIYQGKIGYGLGLSVSDVNNDNLPDVYIGNDFFENDYLYINNGDKTFTEIITANSNALGHTTHFSMGNAIADYNNDGLTDIFSLDMLPENLETYKASGTEYPYPTYENYLKNGYRPQYMQNTLHLNLGNGFFSEIGNLAGIAATEWSWGILLADFDNDGHKDAFISNGIKGASNDMDFINFIANDNIQKNLRNGINEQEIQFITKMPEKKAHNYFFKNNSDLTFTNVSDSWSNLRTSFSNGSVYTDLDNDGDLDLVVNNVNEQAFVLENTSNDLGTDNYLKIQFKGPPSNTMGIGAKISTYTNGDKQIYENFTVQGYLSSVSPTIHLGLGEATVLDSLHVVWPNGFTQTKTNIASNQLLVLDISQASDSIKKTKPIIPKTNSSLFPFAHTDGSSVEFYRDPLIPYANTNRGPSVSIADVNGDERDDIFVGGAKQQAASLFIQEKEGRFLSSQNTLFEEDKAKEDISQVFFHANNDSFIDLLVASGGNEFKEGENLRPRLYRNQNGTFIRDTLQFSNVNINASKAKVWDMENDGDMDVIITSNAVPWEFGKTPKQFIFRNNGKGDFTDITDNFAPELATLGNVNDVLLHDLDGNGYTDLVFVGHWMPISIFMNDGKKLNKVENEGLQDSSGLWNSIASADIDNDGDEDLIVGNWGLNSKLKASATQPMTLYKTDTDENGSVETIITYYHKDIETVLSSKDEIVKQVPAINKTHLSYNAFARATVSQLFPKLKHSKGLQKKVYELASCYFENLGNGSFKKIPMPTLSQVSTVEDILIENDGKTPSIVLIGNNHEISTQLGRMDASHGLILHPSDAAPFTQATYTYLGASGATRSISKINIDNTKGYLISRNNDSLLFIPIVQKQ